MVNVEIPQRGIIELRLEAIDLVIKPKRLVATLRG